VKAEWMRGGPDFVRALEVSEDDKALMLCENAKRLYQI